METFLDSAFFKKSIAWFLGYRTFLRHYVSLKTFTGEDSPPHDKDPIYLRFSVCSVSARSELLFRFTTEPAIANAAHTHTHALTHTSEGRCHMLTQHQHDQLFQMTTQRPDGSGCSDQTV